MTSPMDAPDTRMRFNELVLVSDDIHEAAEQLHRFEADSSCLALDREGC